MRDHFIPSPILALFFAITSRLSPAPNRYDKFSLLRLCLGWKRGRLEWQKRSSLSLEKQTKPNCYFFEPDNCLSPKQDMSPRLTLSRVLWEMHPSPRSKPRTANSVHSSKYSELHFLKKFHPSSLQPHPSSSHPKRGNSLEHEHTVCKDMVLTRILPFASMPHAVGFILSDSFRADCLDSAVFHFHPIFPHAATVQGRTYLPEFRPGDDAIPSNSLIFITSDPTAIIYFTTDGM